MGIYPRETNLGSHKNLDTNICVSHSVTFDSLWPHGLWPASLLSVHGILQPRILEWKAIPFSRGNEGLNPGLLHCRQILYHLSHQGSHTKNLDQFYLFILFKGFSRQEYWSGLPFPSPVDHILSELSTMTRPAWVVPCMAHSFTELDKAVVHVIDWLVFCEYGFQSVSPLMEKDKRLMKASWQDRLRGILGRLLMGGGHAQSIFNPIFCWWVGLCSLPAIYLGLVLSWRRHWHPTPVLLPGKSHGQRSLVGCSPWGLKESNMTERLHFTFHFHALEKAMVTHSSVLAWRIPGMVEPGGRPSMGSHRVGHDWSDLAAAVLSLQGSALHSVGEHHSEILRSALCCAPAPWDSSSGLSSLPASLRPVEAEYPSKQLRT